MNLSLATTDEVDLLAFILDTTIEQWKTQLPECQAAFVQDRSITTVSDLLKLTGSLTEMISDAERIRSRLQGTDNE